MRHLFFAALLLTVGCTKIIYSNQPVKDEKDVGNGEGDSELVIRKAALDLDRYISQMLIRNLFELTNPSAMKLVQIRSFLPLERLEKTIQFKSEKENPGFFVIDNLPPRIAITGDKVGDPIYFNVDLLYTNTPTQKNVPITIPKAVGLLIHELGHHHGLSESTLNDLGARVQRYMEETTYIFSDFLKVTFIEDNTYEHKHKFLVSNETNDLDVTDKLEGVAICLNGDRRGDYRLADFKWRKNNDQTYTLTAELFVMCTGPAPTHKMYPIEKMLLVTVPLDLSKVTVESY